MYILITICIMLFIFTIISCTYLYSQYKQLKKVTPPMPVINNIVNFEQDIQFLNYLIAFKIEYAKSFLLAPMKMAVSSFVTDTSLDKIRDDLVTDIYESLSDSYKKTLSKYFTKDAIIAYITEHVIKELTIAGLESNLSAIKAQNVISANSVQKNKETKNK